MSGSSFSMTASGRYAVITVENPVSVSVRVGDRDAGVRVAVVDGHDFHKIASLSVSFDCQHTGFSPKKQARGRKVACGNGKIASREAAGEKNRGKSAKSARFSAKTCKKCLTAGHDMWYHLTYL
ncbi:MAG: hypothetical protein ACLRSD_11805 [Oscillibacter sp.]